MSASDPPPLHPATTRWIACLQRAKARGLVRAGISIEEAAEGAIVLVKSVESAFRPGPEGEPPFLRDMESNVICREIEAGLVPEEFEQGPIFHPAVTPEPEPRSAREEAA